VREYYTKLAQPQKRIANWGAFNFGAVRVALLIIFLVVLYIAIDLDEFSAGELYSIVAYLWTFVTSTEYLPELMESWTSLKDISRRLRSEDIEEVV
jgi:ABC-type multidrug transport system fused ATPase/permease subunit